MYTVSIYADNDTLLEQVSFSFVDEAEAAATAFENLTDYTVIREWEEE